MKFHYLLILAFLAGAGDACADIYKRVDADGNVTYSNKPIKGGKRIELRPLATLRSYDENKGGDYERVKQTTQRNRDDARRRVLEDELAAEEKLLAEARQNLHDAQDNPRASQPGGQPDPGAAGQDDIRNAQEQVDLHERNVQAIKQELSSIK